MTLSQLQAPDITIKVAIIFFKNRQVFGIANRLYLLQVLKIYLTSVSLSTPRCRIRMQVE